MQDIVFDWRKIISFAKKGNKIAFLGVKNKEEADEMIKILLEKPPCEILVSASDELERYIMDGVKELNKTKCLKKNKKK